jgi:hypothetical protein
MLLRDSLALPYRKSAKVGNLLFALIPHIHFNWRLKHRRRLFLMEWIYGKWKAVLCIRVQCARADEAWITPNTSLHQFFLSGRNCRKIPSAIMSTEDILEVLYPTW